MTLTAITRQKISLSISASRLTEAGRKSYLVSVKWPFRQKVNKPALQWNTQTKATLKQRIMLEEKLITYHLSVGNKKLFKSFTSIGREFEQQYSTGPQSYKAKAEGQSVGWWARAHLGAGMTTCHDWGLDWDWDWKMAN